MEGVREDKAGMNITTLDVKSGYWRTSPNSFEILPCSGEHHCAGGIEPENSCEYGYTGPLCAVCFDGFASVGSGADMHCNVCEGSARLTIAVGFITIAVVILGIVFWCCRSAKKGKKVEETGLRAADSLNDQATRLRSASEAARAKVEAVTGFIENAQPYFKILLAYFQVAGGLSFADLQRL